MTTATITPVMITLTDSATGWPVVVNAALIETMQRLQDEVTETNSHYTIAGHRTKVQPERTYLRFLGGERSWVREHPDIIVCLIAAQTPRESVAAEPHRSVRA